MTSKTLAKMALVFYWVFNPVSHADSFAGRLANVQGVVKVDGVQIQEGAFVKVGNLITTGDGKVTVLLGKETVMHLDRNSVLRVAEYSPGKRGESGTIQLDQGATRTLVRSLGSSVIRKNFFVKTKSAVMGVRGTEVFISAPIDAPSSFSVIRGEALVQLVPPAGAPPQTPVGGAGREFLIRGGQSVAVDRNAAQVQSFDSKVMQKESFKVAPPPARVETKRDLDAFTASNDPFQIPASITTGQNAFLQPNLSLDPVANRGNVPVSLSIGTVTKY